MIVKTGANYQAEGGYIEAGIGNDVITFKTVDIDLNVPVSSSNIYGSLVRGAIKLNGAAAQVLLPEITRNVLGHHSYNTHYVQPDTETAMMWLTEIDIISTALTSTAGYTNPVLSPNSKNCSMTAYGSSFIITVTGNDFFIDIVEGA
jgi:hypothetical protein